ncbi:hypothetical protein K466DRAFT_485877, partial [Polyporus arcularius HHB13444]
MQQPKFTGTTRAISKWQAYVSIEFEKRNNGTSYNARLSRVSDKEANEILVEQWRNMTPEEKKAVTAERVAELEQRRENRASGVRNLPLAQFVDIRETPSSHLPSQMRNAHDRTGAEIFAVVVRGENTAYNKPAVHFSSERVKKFFETVCTGTLWDIACRLEACCIGGIDEMVTSQQEKTLLLKAQLAGLIMAKLKNACRRGEPRRMFYSSFDEQITAKHGVIMENWPIPKFDNPSSLSHLEAEVVLRALESGATRFRSLTDTEWATW